MPVPTESEVRSWTPGERAEVARFLDQLVERPTGTSGVIRRRRLSIVAAAIGALVMLPWIGYLASSLPLAESGGAWRVAWVGFDIMLAFVLMTTAWLGFRRRQVAILGLLVASTMLVTDAWFDVALSYGTREQWGAILSAALLEVPFAILLASSAISILQRTSSTVARLERTRGEATVTLASAVPGRSAAVWKQLSPDHGRRMSCDGRERLVHTADALQPPSILAGCYPTRWSSAAR